jgi:hypothetical protein
VKAWIESRGRGPVEVRPGKAGQFDILIGEHLAYSRYATGRFPSEADLSAMNF